MDSIDVMREYGITTSTGQRAFSADEAARVAAKLSALLGPLLGPLLPAFSLCLSTPCLARLRAKMHPPSCSFCPGLAVHL